MTDTSQGSDNDRAELTTKLKRYDLVVGSPVVYVAEDRLYDLVDGLDAVDAQLVVCRAYRILTVPRADPQMNPFLLEPLEGGPTVECCVDFLLALSRCAPVSVTGTRLRLRAGDHLRVGPRKIGLFLSNSSFARAYPGNAASLRLNGLVVRREYDVEEWPIPAKAVRLRGVTGTYYAGLFRFIDGGRLRRGFRWILSRIGLDRCGRNAESAKS